VEHTCFQSNKDEPKGQIGVSSARNWAKLLNPTRFSIPDRGRTEVNAVKEGFRNFAKLCLGLALCMNYEGLQAFWRYLTSIGQCSVRMGLAFT
jgi:hypothetical protein